LSLAYSSAPNRDLAAQRRERGELAEELAESLVCIFGLPKRWKRADVIVSTYQHIYVSIFNLCYG